MLCNTVVIVSGCPETRSSLESLVTRAGFDAITADSLEVGLREAKTERGYCLVLDTSRGDLVGPERSALLAVVCASRPVLVLTDAGDVPTAVQAIRQGAADVMQKPVDYPVVLEKIKRFLVPER